MGQINKLKDFTRGQLDSALMKIGQDAGMGTADGIRAFLAGELVVSKPARRWGEKEGGNIICFSLTTNGLTGRQWIKRFEKLGIKLSDYAKSLLLSPDFKPTKAGVTIPIEVLKGQLFTDEDRTTTNIRASADKRGLTKPNAEIACLIRETFSDKEIEAMGLTWIITMHEPINDSDGDPLLLGARRYDDRPWLGACCVKPGDRWHRSRGFAFVASPVPPTAGRVAS